MKFGVREICDVVFKAKTNMTIGGKEFKAGQPVLYIDTAKTSTVEGAATTVYAQGGAGNTRLLAWEGEKTLTFTVEDALLSPIGFSILSGAGLFKGSNKKEKSAYPVNVHTTAMGVIKNNTEQQKLVIEIPGLATNETISKDKDAAPFCALVDADGSLTGDIVSGMTVAEDGKSLTKSTAVLAETKEPAAEELDGKAVFVDFYVSKKGTSVSELQIDARHFAGFFYVEASTLFRRQSDGVDMPAELTFPNVKIQSNFTFQMAATGDPSTFTFTMDAFPDYTKFDKTHKVLCVMQIVEDVEAGLDDRDSVMLDDSSAEAKAAME